MTATASLAFEARLDLPFEEAIDRVTEALGAQGFGVLTKIDVRRTLADKIGVDFRDYAILGACNPRLAYRALSARRDVGLLLPCNVTVEREPDGRVLVRIIDPQTMLEAGGLGADVELADVAKEAQARLRLTACALEEQEHDA